MNLENYPILKDMEDETRVSLDTRVLTVGSESSCGIRLAPAFPSRVAHLIYLNGVYTLQDLAMKGGVTINKQAVNTPTVLNHGDIIAFGKRQFQFLLSENTESPKKPCPAAPIDELIEVIISLLRDQDKDVFSELVASVSRLLKCDAARLLKEGKTPGKADTIAMFPSGSSLGRFSNRAIDWARASSGTILARDMEWDDSGSSMKSLKRNLVGSILCTPLKKEKQIIGYLYMDRLQNSEPFNEENRQYCDALRPLFEEIFISRDARERQRNTIARLQKQQGGVKSHILYESPVMKNTISMAGRIALTDTPVFIHGETGTGKELMARFIHDSSNRRERPFVAINCGAISENLIESELFGHEKGAFTGAYQQKTGLFESATGGTLLLDEIGELPLALQVKLLRVLQENEVTRVGSTSPVTVDARIISASNRDLDIEVREGRFREDLFFRLNVINIGLPPLRKRENDIQLIADFFIAKYCQQYGFELKSLDASGRTILQGYHWPGNVRELENAVQKAVVLSTSNRITKKDFQLQRGDTTARLENTNHMTLKEIRKNAEKKAIEESLALWKGNVSKTAGYLSLDRTWLMKMMKELKISPDEYRR